MKSKPENITLKKIKAWCPVDKKKTIWREAWLKGEPIWRICDICKSAKFPLSDEIVPIREK